MLVNTSHDMRNRASVGSLSLKVDFIFHNCNTSHTRINICVHFAGLQWENMYSSPVQDDTTSFGWLCCLILADSFIYFLIAWYVRNVFPFTSHIFSTLANFTSFTCSLVVSPTPKLELESSLAQIL